MPWTTPPTRTIRSVSTCCSRHRDHDGRAAHPRLQRTGREDARTRHEPDDFESYSWHTNTAFRRTAGWGSAGAHHDAPSRVQKCALCLHVPARYQPRHAVKQVKILFPPLSAGAGYFLPFIVPFVWLFVRAVYPCRLFACAGAFLPVFAELFVTRQFEFS